MRRASAALVRSVRLYPDLRRLQSDRRRRYRRPRIAGGADRSQFARLQELDAAVQSGADLHRALASARRYQSTLDRDRPTAVAAGTDPPSLRLLRRGFYGAAAKLFLNRSRITGSSRDVALRDCRHVRVLA